MANVNRTGIKDEKLVLWVLVEQLKDTDRTEGTGIKRIILKCTIVDKIPFLSIYHTQSVYTDIFCPLNTHSQLTLITYLSL